MLVIKQEEQAPSAQSMTIFLLIWFGQMVSVLGSALSRFALGIWIYEQTQSVTLFVLMALFDAIPGIIAAPFAGVLVDRWNRRRVMILSDAMAALATLTVALAIVMGNLQIWHIYLAIAVSSVCGALQWPAYAASITLLVPKQNLGRANGMVQVADGIARIGAPVLAVMLATQVPLQGILFIDLATFLVALSTLLIVRVPDSSPPALAEPQQSLFREATFGWTYLRKQQGLLALLLFCAMTDFMLQIVQVLLPPLVLTFASTAALSTVLSVGGTGALIGGVVMSVWNGPRKRIYGLFAATILQGALLLLGGLQPSIPLITGATFLFLFCTPVIYTCIQTIWQSQVPIPIQGRVFAVRRMTIWIAISLAYLLAGPLADYVFKPLLLVDGPLAGSIGQVIGVGPGRGIGLLFIVLGLLTIGITLSGAAYTRLRSIEDESPDVEQKETSTEGQRDWNGENSI